MKKQHFTPTGVSKTGLVLSPDGLGYAVDWTELPSSDHFFLATDCLLKQEATGLKMLFGAASSFDDSENYESAVEIHFPIFEAKMHLYRSVFKELSGNGNTIFYESVTKGFEKLKIDPTALAPVKPKKLPLNKHSSFRIFPANFAAMSFSGTQGLIEFFEVTPDLIHLLMKKDKMRPFSGVKPVVSIILDTVTLYRFMNSCRDLIEKVITSEEVGI